MPLNDPTDVAIAFALVTGAGLATAVGASVVFFPSLVKLASRRVLAGGLGISGGVMTYVSFVDIFPKTIVSFAEVDGIDDGDAYLYTTLCFFGGALVMLLVDFIVKILSGHSHDNAISEVDNGGEDISGQQCFTCSPDPVGDLEIVQDQANEIIKKEQESKDGSDDVSNEENAATVEKSGNHGSQAEDVEDLKKEKEKKKLIKMGMNTAIAIALHNFPEGLATFVATVNDPRVGAVLAIAIGIHNIPEGLCVALPIYYATGNRLKAFGWALLSGASEPIAALLGWAVLANSFSEVTYGILFGLVGGMMVIITMRELLPTAHRYDPEDSVVTYSFLFGMFIMALSLVLFNL